MDASRWSPTNATPLGVVDEERVRGAVAGAGDHPQVAPARADAVPVGEHVVGVPAVRRLADEVEEPLVGGDDGIGHAVVAHERLGVAPVRLGAVVVPLAVGGRPVERAHRGTRVPRDARREAAVVQVVMRDEDELQVLDARSRVLQAGPQRGVRLLAVGARVDQGQRLAPQQPRVDGLDVGQRDGDPDDVIHDARWSADRACGRLNRVQYCTRGQWARRGNRAGSIRSIVTLAAACMI